MRAGNHHGDFGVCPVERCHDSVDFDYRQRDVRVDCPGRAGAPAFTLTRAGMRAAIGESAIRQRHAGNEHSRVVLEARWRTGDADPVSGLKAVLIQTVGIENSVAIAKVQRVDMHLPIRARRLNVKPCVRILLNEFNHGALDRKLLALVEDGGAVMRMRRPCRRQGNQRNRCNRQPFAKPTCGFH